MFTQHNLQQLFLSFFLAFILVFFVKFQNGWQPRCLKFSYMFCFCLFLIHKRVGNHVTCPSPYLLVFCVVVVFVPSILLLFLNQCHCFNSNCWVVRVSTSLAPLADVLKTFVHALVYLHFIIHTQLCT